MRVQDRLARCDSFEQQKEWCRRALLSGKTLTDPGLWISGCDPDKIIRALRKEGVPVETVYVRTVDAAGQEHPRTLAWRARQGGTR